ncbi:helix-turn-helix domain-containing protein [Natronobacterium texcoconense]|uniref:HTH DNA binding domain-containing protein n=1 Tax=Natronobacterium texcoconense TaxID=1095778 RepID=A0A1H1AWJ0_NATTX|nr:helix-turn-helix domain-containing protein [Natronobacterium texcoconense]SDQ44024.1 HTH DNA binding domain-containing protein [Natronobacterium texcoconense]
MSTSHRRSPSLFAEDGPIRAVLEVEPADSVGCALVEETPNATSVTQTIGSRDSCTVCRVAATVREEDELETKYLSTEVSDHCVRTTLDRFECITDLEGVDDGALVVSVVVDDRAGLTSILDALEETGADVRLRRIGQGEDGDDGTIELDAMAITDKQREAAKLAVERGYYETPRRTDLEALATELDVSKSAVSQRLNAVERVLIRRLVD